MGGHGYDALTLIANTEQITQTSVNTLRLLSWREKEQEEVKIVPKW